MGSETKLDPVYLIVGEDELKREIVCKRLVNRVAEVGDLDFNMEQFKAEDDKKDAEKGDRVVDRAIAACEIPPFMSDYRLVIINDVDKLNKDDTDKLADYVSNPLETTVLCLIATELDGRTKLYKACSKSSAHAIISCAPKKGKELFRFVENNMAGAYGISLEFGAGEVLVEYVGTSTVRLDAELKRLRDAFGQGTHFTAEDIRRNVTRTSDLKIWDLQDALSERDARKLEHVLSNLPMSPYPTNLCPLTYTGALAMCIKRIREIMTAKALIARGEGGDDRLAEALRLGALKWKAKFYRQWAANYSAEELRDALMRAERCEHLMKSGGDPELELERWLLATCGC